MGKRYNPTPRGNEKVLFNCQNGHSLDRITPSELSLTTSQVVYTRTCQQCGAVKKVTKNRASGIIVDIA